VHQDISNNNNNPLLKIKSVVIHPNNYSRLDPNTKQPALVVLVEMVL
jgi:hypothetical protein